MQKRGQIYILIAVVIAMVVFGLVTVVNKVSQEDINSQFERLSDNYASESAKLINSFIANPDVGISSAFVNFTLMFTSYAKTINPKFGLIYAFYYEDKLYIGNYLDTRIITECEGCKRKSVIDGCFEEIPATVDFGGLALDVGGIYNTVIDAKCQLILNKDNGDGEGNFTGDPTKIDITIREVPYSFKIKKGHPEVIIVSWEKREEQRKVFTEGNFVEESTSGPIKLSQVCSEMEPNECDRSLCQNGQNGCFILCSAYPTREECSMDSEYCTWSEEGGCENA